LPLTWLQASIAKSAQAKDGSPHEPTTAVPAADVCSR